MLFWWLARTTQLKHTVQFQVLAATFEHEASWPRFSKKLYGFLYTTKVNWYGHFILFDFFRPLVSCFYKHVCSTCSLNLFFWSFLCCSLVRHYSSISKKRNYNSYFILDSPDSSWRLLCSFIFRNHWSSAQTWRDSCSATRQLPQAFSFSFANPFMFNWQLYY